jgi:hypothetical protein
LAALSDAVMGAVLTQCQDEVTGAPELVSGGHIAMPNTLLANDVLHSNTDRDMTDLRRQFRRLAKHITIAFKLSTTNRFDGFIAVNADIDRLVATLEQHKLDKIADSISNIKNLLELIQQTNEEETLENLWCALENIAVTALGQAMMEIRRLSITCQARRAPFRRSNGNR